MTPRQLKTLALVTLLVAAAAAVAVYGRGPGKGAGDTASGLLAPAFAGRLNAVSGLHIVTPDGQFSIARDADGKTWRLAEKDGYRVPFGKVKKLLVGLARASRLEPKTRKPENYPKIGVGDPLKGADGDKKGGTLVEVRAGDEVLLSLLVGHRRAARGTAAATSYVRLSGEKQAWLVDHIPAVGSRAVDWLDSQIMRIGRRRIRGAKVVPPKGPALDVSRASADQYDFTVANLPKGREMASPSAANAFAGAISNLSFEDVAKSSDDGDGPAWAAEYLTFDGLRLRLKIRKQGDEFWLTGAADYDPMRMIRPDGKAKAAVMPEAPEDGAAEARALNRRLAGWAFRLPLYKGQEMTRALADVLKKPPAKAADKKAP